MLLNDPRGLRDANEKLYALHFARTCRRRSSASSAEQIFAFVDESAARPSSSRSTARAAWACSCSERADKNARAIVDILTEEGKRA